VLRDCRKASGAPLMVAQNALKRRTAERRTSDAELQTAIMHTKRKTADIKSGHPLVCEVAALPMMFQGDLESCADAGRQTAIMRTKRNAADIISRELLVCEEAVLPHGMSR
jgi:hypothetical protein